MDLQHSYEDTVQRLNTCGYVVLADEEGYFVQHLTNCDRRSTMHTLNDLVHFANLIERGTQRQHSYGENH